MGHSTYLWVKAFHVVGILVWAGGLMGLANLLVAVGRSDSGARAALVGLARSTAMMMDIGATLAIALGTWLILGTKALGSQWPMKQPWMHVKLTIVVIVILGIHGFLRAKLGKYRKGKDTKPVPPAIVPILSLALVAVVVFAVARPIG